MTRAQHPRNTMTLTPSSHSASALLSTSDRSITTSPAAVGSAVGDDAAMRPGSDVRATLSGATLGIAGLAPIANAGNTRHDGRIAGSTRTATQHAAAAVQTRCRSDAAPR